MVYIMCNITPTQLYVHISYKIYPEITIKNTILTNRHSNVRQNTSILFTCKLDFLQHVTPRHFV